MNLRCFLGLHSMRKSSHSVPVKMDGEFNEFVYDGHFALGECVSCGNLSMVQCAGKWKYYPSDMKVKDEWLKELSEVNKVKGDG